MIGCLDGNYHKIADFFSLPSRHKEVVFGWGARRAIILLDNLSIGSADVMTAKDCAALMMTSGQAKNHSRNLIQKH